jgi:hypothetical protein
VNGSAWTAPPNVPTGRSSLVSFARLGKTGGEAASQWRWRPCDRGSTWMGSFRQEMVYLVYLVCSVSLVSLTDETDQKDRTNQTDDLRPDSGSCLKISTRPSNAVGWVLNWHDFRATAMRLTPVLERRVVAAPPTFEGPPRTRGAAIEASQAGRRL